MRQLGWISLFIVVLIAACGPPTITDLDNNGNPVGDSDDDDDGGGDDDDDGSSSPVPSGSAQPTLTNVPSFATWQNDVQPILEAGTCNASSCHQGSSGGFTYAGNAQSAKNDWFQSICNRDSGLNEGIQSYDPPTGRLRQYLIGQEAATHTAIGNNQALVDAWLAQGSGTTVPNCMDFYDLANSF